MEKRIDLGGTPGDPNITIEEVRRENSVLSSENAVLKTENASLKKQIAAKDDEIRARDEEINRLTETKHTRDLPPEREKVLIAIARSHSPVAEHMLASQLQMNPKIVEMHCQELQVDEYITGEAQGVMSGYILWRVEPKGTKYLTERGLFP